MGEEKGVPTALTKEHYENTTDLLIFGESMPPLFDFVNHQFVRAQVVSRQQRVLRDVHPGVRAAARWELR